jgi:hypothetical protein
MTLARTLAVSEKTDHYWQSAWREGGEMLLAASSSSYPLLNLFWTMCILFLWVIWIWILIWVFIDIFRSPDLRLGQGPVVPIRVAHPAHRRAGLPDRPRRFDARAGSALAHRFWALRSSGADARVDPAGYPPA